MKKSYGKCYVTFLFVLFCLSGCGAIDYHLKSGEDAVERIRTTRIEYENRFIGESKEVILKDLGKPSYIQKETYCLGRKYSEGWVYKIKGTFWEGNIPQAVGLYFDGDNVRAVGVW